MSDLFTVEKKTNVPKPLAEEIRPQTLDDFIGQMEILGQGRLLRNCIESGNFNSLIFFGPPGCGKTSLARIISTQLDCEFIGLSAVELSVPELKKILHQACEERKFSGQTTLIFIDEIHRFNKSQQDSLLKDIESGEIKFIGATTHNPNFYITPALSSRSILFELNSLQQDDLQAIFSRALARLKEKLAIEINYDDDSRDFLIENCEGDARRLCNILELAINSSEKSSGAQLSRELIEDCLRSKAIKYQDDDHYNCASAFIKSMRGSDADASIYWLARMLCSGEDIRFISRRLMIFASEDVGNADPRALQVCVSAHQACETIGMPEARIILAQATTYCATAPKSNASYVAINQAMADVKKKGIQPIPPHLRDPQSSSGRTSNYLYPHDYDNGFVAQEYMPNKTEYYQPVKRGYETRIKERMDYWQGSQNDEQN